ncbi:MAG TPA: EAL domain-containing protein [Alphaproteobacteria bacterium]|nr:EAL domain-containing protein [Alphaproteobacteria bacterium]
MNAAVLKLCSYFRFNAASRKGAQVFRVEHFYPISNVRSGVPECEFLLNHDDCEGFFKEVRDQRNSYGTDMFLFDLVLKNAQDIGVRRFSFNIDLASAFEPDFAESAQKSCLDCGFLPSGVVFEITEHAEIPEGASEAVLLNILDHGFGIAIDDFDPYKPQQVERLARLASYARILKFDHSLGERFAKGQAEQVVAEILKYRALYPDKIFVLEGVSPEALGDQNSYLYELGRAGIDVAQEFVPKENRQAGMSSKQDLKGREFACA